MYPEELRNDIDALSEIIFHEVNNGVYKCGFARSQEAYEEAYDVLFARLDELEERLSTRRFLFGDYITDSDVRLYTTLARFDVAYYSAFKCNRNMIVDFPRIYGVIYEIFIKHQDLVIRLNLKRLRFITIYQTISRVMIKKVIPLCQKVPMYRSLIPNIIVNL